MTAVSTAGGADSNQVFAQVRDRYASVGVTTLPRRRFNNNTFAILVRATPTRAPRSEGDVRQESTGRIGVPGLATSSSNVRRLQRPGSCVHGLQFANQPRVMDLNLIYRAVASNEIDVTHANERPDRGARSDAA